MQDQQQEQRGPRHLVRDIAKPPVGQAEQEQRRGNEIVVAAVRALEHHVIGRRLSEITSNLRGFYRDLTVDKQLRWLGPEKGILHMATGALINAVWDLWAKRDGKPMWKHLADMTPEQIVNAIDFTYITDVLTPEQALEILRAKEAGKKERAEEMLRDAVAVIVDDGESPGGRSSTIVDATGEQGRVLRRGALSLDELNDVLEPLGATLTDDEVGEE